MQTQSTTWAYTRVLADSRLRDSKKLDQLIDGTEGDKIVSITVPGYICTSPGDLPVKLLGKPPKGMDASDGITMQSLMYNDVHIENNLRLAQAHPDSARKLDGKANVGLCQSRLDHYEKMRTASNRELLNENFWEYHQLAQVHGETWKTRLLAVSVAGGLAVMGGGMLLGFPGPPVAIAGIAATFATGWALGKPMADRWLEKKCAGEIRAGMEAPHAYWQEQVEVRSEIDRRLRLHQVDPDHEIPVPPTPVSAVEVRADSVVVGNVRVKRRD
jgi:hypothetical protein